MNYICSVLTCAFGNYDALLEIPFKRDDVEFICMTDDPNLTSNTWNIAVCDGHMFTMSPKTTRWKYPKFHPFEFVSSDVCLYIDASVEIQEDFIDKLIIPFINSEKEIATIFHPCRDDVREELGYWMANRGISNEEGGNIMQYLANMEYSANWGLVQDCLILEKNTKNVNRVNDRTFELCHQWSSTNILYRDDQVPFTIILQHFIDDSQLELYHPNLIDSIFKWKPRGEYAFANFSPSNMPRHWKGNLIDGKKI